MLVNGRAAAAQSVSSAPVVRSRPTMQPRPVAAKLVTKKNDDFFESIPSDRLTG